MFNNSVQESRHQTSIVIPKIWDTAKVSPRTAPGLPEERCKATAQEGGPRGLRVEESELRVWEVKAARVQGQTTREERMAQGENLRDLQTSPFRLQQSTDQNARAEEHPKAPGEDRG